jgi:hypothetical protein
MKTFEILTLKILSLILLRVHQSGLGGVQSEKIIKSEAELLDEIYEYLAHQ